MPTINYPGRMGTIRGMVALFASLLFVLTLAGCGKSAEEKVVGTYRGQSGLGTLVLQDDGTGTIALVNPRTGSPTETRPVQWKVEDGNLTMTTDAVDYELHAEVPDDGKSLLVTGDEGRWAPWLYTKE